jgi:hypothetical protein
MPSGEQKSDSQQYDEHSPDSRFCKMQIWPTNHLSNVRHNRIFLNKAGIESVNRMALNEQQLLTIESLSNRSPAHKTLPTQRTQLSLSHSSVFNSVMPITV